MASPLASGKQSVSLTSSGAVSKIRRDPVPIATAVTVSDADKRDTWTVVIGILTFTLALLVIGIGLVDHVG